MDKYKVTCEKCGISDELTVTQDKQVFYKDHTLLSARYRPDMKWGFECVCGQDSRIAPEELGVIDRLVRGGEHAVEAIKKSLTPKNELKFRMEKI